MLDNYAEETWPLFKMLRTEAFRFVVVRYNHFSLVKQLEEDLKARFPERPFVKVNALKDDYRAIMDAYSSLPNGFLFIENFEDVLKEERDTLNTETPEFAEKNARRKGITAGLNLRRDKLAKQPVAIFVFVPASTGELYARTIMEKMPDLWSFRSLILDLEKDTAAQKEPVIELNLPKAELQGEILKKDPTELNRLLSLLNDTPESETAYRLTLYPQIVTEAKNIGKYELAFSNLDSWENLAPDTDKAWIWIQKGDILVIYGQLGEALSFYEKAKNLAQHYNHRPDLALSFERLGIIYATMGDLNKALEVFEQFNDIEKSLVEQYPNEPIYISNWAIANQKLGDTYRKMGNISKALEFFEEYNRLSNELYENYPQYLELKSSLATSYSKLGDTHSSLGNLEKALGFYETQTKHFEELYQEFPENVEFKNALSVSYSKLGEVNNNLGNLNKALGLFETGTKLFEELSAAFPTNENFKNGLAISYGNLGFTHRSLGNLNKALGFFETETKLFEELYSTFPRNINFKNGLAISWCNLAEFHKTQNNLKKAKSYFQQAEKLWLELVRDAPQYVQFQQNLDKVQKELNALD